MSEICREQLWIRVYSEVPIMGGREDGKGESVCGGVKVRACRENTKWERGADGTLSLFTEWHHITTKFNLISTKLHRSIWIQPPRRAERHDGRFFITVKENVVPLICSSGSPQSQMESAMRRCWANRAAPQQRRRRRMIWWEMKARTVW